jgi:hypothetical protein
MRVCRAHQTLFGGFEMRTLPLLLVTATLGIASVTACSDQTDTPTDTTTAAESRSAAPLREGALYVAELHPLNPRVQQTLDPDRRTPRGVAQGKAYFRVEGGMLHAVVDVRGAEPADAAFPEGLHPQHIHEASRCPTQSADVNGDGIVDVIEGLPFYGPIMIPLDANLPDTSSQVPTFPLATGSRGTYHFTAEAPVAALEAALGHALNLPSRHVVIHGVDLATPLPATVQTLPGVPAQLTLPIACGELHEVG